MFTTAHRLSVSSDALCVTQETIHDRTNTRSAILRKLLRTCEETCRAHHALRILLRQCRRGLAWVAPQNRGDHVLVRERLAREPRTLRASPQSPEAAARAFAHGRAGADLDGTASSLDGEGQGLNMLEQHPLVAPG
jgi:hypothetical protein